MVAHADLTEEYLHEPKGASTANEGDALLSNGDGTSYWGNPSAENIVGNLENSCSHGSYKYADTATAITPIVLTTAGIEYEITNDGLGTETYTEWPVSGQGGSITDLWDSTENALVFTGLSLGDTLDVLLEITVTTTSANAVVMPYLDLDADGTPFRLYLGGPVQYKTAGTYQLDVFTPFFMKSQAILDGYGRFKIESDDAGTEVIVRGMYIRATHRY